MSLTTPRDGDSVCVGFTGNSDSTARWIFVESVSAGEGLIHDSNRGMGGVIALAMAGAKAEAGK